MKWLLIIFIALTTLSGCAEKAANQNANKPPPEILDNNFDDALKEFVGKNYQGWHVKGVNDEFEMCKEAMDMCNVHISNGREDKILTVKSEKFKKADGHYYLQVILAPPPTPQPTTEPTKEPKEIEDDR